MENDKKYQLCISVQQRVLTELRKEFLVSTVNKQFPSCVSYQNGEYTYDLDVIRVIFAHYFKETVNDLNKSLNNSEVDFLKAVLKGIGKAGKNVKNIKLQKRFREEFLKKSNKIKTKYFDNPDENDENNLRIKIKEYNEYLNCTDDDDFNDEYLYNTLNDCLEKFKDDLRELKAIRSEVFGNEKR